MTTEVKDREKKFCSLCFHNLSQQAHEVSTDDLYPEVLCLGKLSVLQQDSELCSGTKAAYSYKANFLYPPASFRATTTTPVLILHPIVPKDLPVNQVKCNLKLPFPPGNSIQVLY